MRLKLLLVSLSFCFLGTSHAELFDRGGGMIYDDVLDVTWLQDATMAGSLPWDDAVAWTDGLSFGGFANWRLPSMDVNDDGVIIECSVASEAACRDNELGYMFYQNLAGNIGDNLVGARGLFQNINAVHWSGTEYAPAPFEAWAFLFINSEQDHFTKLSFQAAWAVHGGDVASIDTDADGVADVADNCTLVTNTGQQDIDEDGYGNACDPDFNNDCVVNFGDFAAIAANFLSNTTPLYDLNSDGVVNFGDISIFTQFFLGVPGPSGLNNLCD